MKRTATKSGYAHELVFEVDSSNGHAGHRLGLPSRCRCDNVSELRAQYVRTTDIFSASNSITTLSSNAVVLALNAQALLLKELVQEHQKRAADFTQNNQAEKAKWESDLANELREKSARLQKSVDQSIQPLAGTNDLKAAGEIDDQLVFVSTVEARLEQLQQELSAAIQDGRFLSTQIGTNKASDDIASLSVALGENQKLVKQLQKEQLDIELRKLEFRALCKAMQK